MREPSIHITKSQFEEILSTLEVYNFPVEAFFMIARKKAINHRAVLVNGNRNTKRVTNILLANKGDASLIADLIYATRIKMKHRGVKKINEGNQRDWTLCKKIAEICNIFCQDFQLETREGFIKYIEIGLKRMNDARNLLQRLISMQENITSQYESLLEWDNVSNSYKQLIVEIQRHYVKKVADATGIYEEYLKNPEKMIHFLRLFELCTERDWNSIEFVDAQFESLAWCNGLPDIAQLYNDKAIERYTKYKFKVKGKQQLSEEPEVEGSLWDKIK